MRPDPGTADAGLAPSGGGPPGSGTLTAPTTTPATGARVDTAGATVPPSGRRPARWASAPLLRPVAIYLASRVVVGTTIAVSAALTSNRAPGGHTNILDAWDGRWFLRAAANGWPSTLPMKQGHEAASTVAFFPGFPLAIRWFAAVTGLSQPTAGAIISSVTGLTAAVAVWVLVRHYAGPRLADRGTLLLVFFPGAFVFSLVYSEGLVITCVAFGLLALLRRQWWLAGLLGLVATATTPTALAFVASCAWCSGRALLRRQDRDWWSLLAPVVSSLGFLGYMAWLWAHTGVLMAWRLTERGGWDSYPSLWYPFRLVGHWVRDPVAVVVTTDILVAGLVVAAVGAVVAFRQRQPAPVLLYGLLAGAIAAISAPVGLRPRFLLLAFPLVVAIGTRLQSWRYTAALGASAGLLVAFTVLSTTSSAVFP